MLFEVVLKLTFVASLVAVTDAFGTTAPLASLTTPTMRPVAVCAIAESDAGQHTSATIIASKKFFRAIGSPD
jgi:hypothetical protein